MPLGRAAAAVLCAAAAGTLVAAAGSAAPGRAKQPQRAHLQLLAHADPGGGLTGDVYAWHGFAYLGSWHGVSCAAQGVRVYDIRNPRVPQLASTFADGVSDPAVAGSWTEKTIVKTVKTPSFKGDLAVTSFQACRPGAFQGFGLYDLRNPAAPRQLALVRTDPLGSHEIWLAARGARAYVYTAIPFSEFRSSPDYDPKSGTATIPGHADFRIIDVSRPARPVEVGQWGAWKKLGIDPRRGRGGYNFNYVHSVITNAGATRAYLSYWDLGTVILDITRPSSPRYLGRTDAIGDPEGDAHSAALAAGGKILIETHEHGDSQPTIYDISHPSRPRRLADFADPGSPPVAVKGAAYYTTGVHDPKVSGKLALFSWYRRGVVVADLSRPGKPRYLTRFVPPPAPDPDGGHVCGEPCTMVWGVAVSGNVVLVSDMMSGLWTLRLDRS